MKLSYGLILIFLTPWLASCDQLGIESPAAEQAREEAEGKAIGSACRQTGRALEECYQLNRRAPKAAIFTGWRDMDGYMRENKISEIKAESSTNPPPGNGQPLKAAEEAAGTEQQKSGATVAKPTEGNRKTPEAKPAEAVPAQKGRSRLSH
jgi:hypothetical protein